MRYKNPRFTYLLTKINDLDLCLEVG